MQQTNTVLVLKINMEPKNHPNWKGKNIIWTKPSMLGSIWIFQGVIHDWLGPAKTLENERIPWRTNSRAHCEPGWKTAGPNMIVEKNPTPSHPVTSFYVFSMCTVWIVNTDLQICQKNPPSSMVRNTRSYYMEEQKHSLQDVYISQGWCQRNAELLLMATRNPVNSPVSRQFSRLCTGYCTSKRWLFYFSSTSHFHLMDYCFRLGRLVNCQILWREYLIRGPKKKIHQVSKQQFTNSSNISWVVLPVTMADEGLLIIAIPY